MKNNQFKKIIKQQIEHQCKLFDLVSVNVDKTNNHRMIYIYNTEWVWVGMFSLYFTDDSVHLQFTNLVNTPLICKSVEDICVKYTTFERVIDVIKTAFNIMWKEG